MTKKTELEVIEPEAEVTDQQVIDPDALSAVAVRLSVELGRVVLPLKQVRALRQGEVVQLDRPVGEALDIRINGRLVARGEVVATEAGRYGIRVSQVVRTTGGSSE